MNRSGSVFILLMLLAGSVSFSAHAEGEPHVSCDTVYLRISGSEKTVPLIIQEDPAAKDDTKKKKFVSALFAFPFPFGFMGAHRVMLGTKPWVPVVYVATFGGCFGILPLIDFCVITFSKDISPYENNPHIFMWVTSPDPPKEGGNPE